MGRRFIWLISFMLMLGFIMPVGVSQAADQWMSISSSAFNPDDSDYEFTRLDQWLKPKNGWSRFYYASVNLPHLAKVLTLRFNYWNNGAAGLPYAVLYRCKYSNNTREAMAICYGKRSSGFWYRSNTNIQEPDINNKIYAYSVRVYLPTEKNYLKSVRITYNDDNVAK